MWEIYYWQQKIVISKFSSSFWWLSLPKKMKKKTYDKLPIDSYSDS